MATARQVYVSLRTATEGSRELDVAIAELLGWERSDTYITDLSTGNARATPQWSAPEGGSPSKVPAYTTNLDAAYKLASDHSNGGGISVSWEDNDASATIGDTRRYSTAPTPALALCIAAVIMIATSSPGGS